MADGRLEMLGIIQKAIEDSVTAETENLNDRPLSSHIFNALIDHGGGYDHVVNVPEDGYSPEGGGVWRRAVTVMHPIWERFKDHDLFDCPYTTQIIADQRWWDMPPGRYTYRNGDYGVEVERVEA